MKEKNLKEITSLLRKLPVFHPPENFADEILSKLEKIKIYKIVSYSVGGVVSSLILFFLANKLFKKYAKGE